MIAISFDHTIIMIVCIRIEINSIISKSFDFDIARMYPLLGLLANGICVPSMVPHMFGKHVSS